MSPLFISLRVRNYRLFASGQVVSNTGSWMQRTAQDWLVLTLSHNSGFALGVVTGLQFLPVLLFGLYGGVVADRYDKRLMLMITQTSMGLLALLLGVLDLVGAVSLWQVYVFALALGFVTAFDNPVRQAFVREIVGVRELPNAVSLNSATFNLARVIGPAVAGLLISGYGTSWVFLINAASFIAVLTGLGLMRTEELYPSERTVRAKGQTREGLAYVRQRDDLLFPIVLIGLIGMFGLNFPVTIALMAKVTFHRGADSYGLLGSALALGSLAGALLSAHRGGRGIRPRARTYLASAFLFGLFEAISGVMPSYWTFASLLVLTGAAMLIFANAVNTILQLSVDPLFRGRVLGLYLLVFLGSTPIGAPLVGLIAEHFGARSSLTIGGAISALSAVVCGLLMWRRRTLPGPPPGDAVVTPDLLVDEKLG